ncbi:unnamed protein product [Hanseniaspora opuntiae]
MDKYIIKNKEKRQSKYNKLLKYNEPLAYLSTSKTYEVNTNFKHEKKPDYKALILEETLNESIAQRDDDVDKSTCIIFAKPFNKHMKGHYYKYNIDEINNVYTVFDGLDLFNMDELRQSIKANFVLKADDVFMLCAYDIFHHTDLRITFMNDLKKYEIDFDPEHAEEDVWEGVYVSEFTRMFQELDDYMNVETHVSKLDDFCQLSSIKVEFQLFDLLIKYAPYSLQTGFDKTSGFNEVDYLNNNMIVAIKNFFSARADGKDSLKMFLTKLIDYLDSHEVYLLMYLYLINWFEIEDEAFMNLVNQAVNVIKDPFLIKQYLLLQLRFFERNSKYSNICFTISVKLFEISPKEAFIQLNLIKYLYLTKNFKTDLFDLELKHDHKDNTRLEKHQISLKNFHFDYLLTEYANAEIKEVENIKILTHGNVFFNYPESSNGYVNFIWDNKAIFEDSVTSNAASMDQLLTMQMECYQNGLINNCLIKYKGVDKQFVNYLSNITSKDENNVIRKYLDVRKRTLSYLQSTAKRDEKLICSSYYFLGMYESCIIVAIDILDFKFDRFVFNMFLQSTREVEDINLSVILKYITVAMSLEVRFYNNVHLAITQFVKEELMHKRGLNKEQLIDLSVSAVDAFINEKVMKMIVHFYNSI